MSYIYGASAGQPYHFPSAAAAPASQPLPSFHDDTPQNNYSYNQAVAWLPSSETRPNTPAAMDDDDSSASTWLAYSESQNIPLVPIDFSLFKNNTEVENREPQIVNRYPLRGADAGQIPAISLTPATPNLDLDTEVDDVTELLRRNFQTLDI